MPSSSLVRARAFAHILLFYCWIIAGASKQLSVSEVFTRTRLLSNLTVSAHQQLLEALARIENAPLATPLRVVHELQQVRVAHTYLDLFNAHQTINASSLQAWLDRLGIFLDRYLHGVCAVHHGDVVVTVNLTAVNGLPMMRRALLAKLVTAWLTTLNQQVPEAALPKLEHVVRKLYRIHTDSVVQKGVMEYFHISKAGGTSWNTAAKLNGCIRARSAGSHVKGFGDECRWIDQGVYRNLTGKKILWGRWGRVSRTTRVHGCRARYDFVMSRGFSYISNEYTLQGGHESVLDAHICPQFVNVVTLRDPVKRMESNIRFIMMNVKHAFRRRDAVSQFEQLFCNASAEFWQALAPPVADNYIVRSFLGAEGFHTPVGGISREHVAAAREQLLQFDLVLDLDAGAEANDRVVQQGLGWSAALSVAHVLDSAKLSVRMQLNYSTCHPDPSGWEALTRRQWPDQELYKFGRVVNQLDELWLDLTRALGEQPEQLQCGMLWRGSNNSALATAIRRMAKRLGISWAPARVGEEGQGADAVAADDEEYADGLEDGEAQEQTVDGE